MIRPFHIAFVALLMGSPSIASDFTTALEKFYRTDVSPWAGAQVLIDAIAAQNSETALYDQAQIDALDQAWRSEIGQANTPTIEPVLNSAAAEFLRDQVQAADGRITEIFVMDARGLNVAASDTTSDFWQGDEAKFSETFPIGAGAMHVSEVEFDESTQRYQGQISVTITDPSTGMPIGAMTIGVDAESMM